MNRLYPIIEELYQAADRLMFNIGEDGVGVGDQTPSSAHHSFTDLYSKYSMLLNDETLELDTYDVLLLVLDDIQKSYSRFLFENPIVSSNTVRILKDLKRAIFVFTSENDLDFIFVEDEFDASERVYKAKGRTIAHSLDVIQKQIDYFLLEIQSSTKDVVTPLLLNKAAPVLALRADYNKTWLNDIQEILDPVFHDHFSEDDIILINNSLFDVLFQGTMPGNHDFCLPEEKIPREVYCYAFHLVKQYHKRRSKMKKKHLVIAEYLKCTFPQSFVDMDITSIGKYISSESYSLETIKIPGVQDRETPKSYYAYLKKSRSTQDNKGPN